MPNPNKIPELEEQLAIERMKLLRAQKRVKTHKARVAHLVDSIIRNQYSKNTGHHSRILDN